MLFEIIGEEAIILEWKGRDPFTAFSRAAGDRSFDMKKPRSLLAEKGRSPSAANSQPIRKKAARIQSHRSGSKARNSTREVKEIVS